MTRGDDRFAEFVHSASPRLLHAAYLLTGDRHRAEDAVQTALTRTYAAWARVRHSDAYAYTRKVLANHVIDQWRRPLKEYATEEPPELPANGDVSREVTRNVWLMEMLAGLTGRERAVVVLRHYFDLPEAEVARELKVTVGTVKRTNHRALAKLRVSVGDEAPLVSGKNGGEVS
ncbi:SigE family RNA polymerase sigma factor [Amycolatopsis minnesotensis]|uniref:SigE family RNA polymerase sigma factor n=1 Tax=Amycolatopsis minnesotensis TaxID=337894 RepID=A0ABN2SCC0_9PSEU